MHVLTNKSRVSSITTLLALTLHSSEEMYVRKYYRIQYINSEPLIFFTTNEPDSNYNIRKLDEDFQVIPGFDHLVNDFDSSDFINHIINGRFNSPPKYIYYDIVLIDDLLKPLLLKYLQEKISGFTISDLTDYELTQINRWLQYLKK